MQVAYERLKEKLLRDELRPGDRLANRQLGAELGLSTVTVREAIHRLTSEGLIEHVPNAGAFVRAPSVKDIRDLYEFRGALELLAVKTLCEHMPIHVATELQAICDSMRDVCREVAKLPDQRLRDDLLERWNELDRRFHELLFEAADNVWLRRSIAQVDLLARVFGSKPRTFPYQDVAWTWKMHLRLARAMRRRDLRAASAALVEHDRRGLESSLAAARARRDRGPDSDGDPPAPEFLRDS